MTLEPRIIDMGVLAIHNLPLTREFFARFDILLIKLPFTLTNLTILDFRDGRYVTLPDDQNAALDAFRGMRRGIQVLLNALCSPSLFPRIY